MLHTPLDRFLPAVLSIGLVLGSNAPGLAQEGPGLSSGSGAGTGSGGTTGVQRNESGSASGVGPGGAGTDANDPGRTPFRAVPPRFSVPSGPGVDVVFPDDPGLLPLLRIGPGSDGGDGKAPTLITEDVLKNARDIRTASERSLAFQLIAKGAIYSNQFKMAHQAIEEAAAAALEEPVPLTHDLRLIAVITTFSNLTDAVIREGKGDAPGLAAGPANTPDPLPRKLDRKTAIRLARLEWNRAAYLARMIHNPTNRNEMLYRIVDSQALGSIAVATEYAGSELAAGISSDATPNPAPPRPTSKKEADELRTLADQILEDAVKVADMIERPVWKGKAYVRIAVGAADSVQYDRGLKVARAIADPEYRTEGLLLIAESQCRSANRLDDATRKDTLNQEATRTYTDVARAVAEVRQMGLRGVCTGFLVDSLISMGRFDDARACVALYPEEYQRFVALGAIAESQGRRGSAEGARQWITREMPESYRPTLYRRVTRGVLDSIEQNRSQDNLRSDLAPQ